VKSARFYDALYAPLKDYRREVARLQQIISEHRPSGGQTLLDVGCGTGQHLAGLRRFYSVEGLDLDPDMLSVARSRLPGVPLHRGDMAEFELGRAFDVVVCLFGAIGYVRTRPRLRQAIQTMGRHLRPGGVLILEPWLTPETYRPGAVHASFVDQPELKVARMNVSQVRGRLSLLDFHYLVATPAGTEHFRERHQLGLFTHQEYRAAFQAAGLTPIHDSVGLNGRGLYIAAKA
jgi:SAM-dependent methyltransferase